MTSVTRPPRTRSALVSAVAGWLLLAGAAGCDSGDDIEGDQDGGAVRPRPPTPRAWRP